MSLVGKSFAVGVENIIQLTQNFLSLKAMREMGLIIGVGHVDMNT